MPTGIQKWAASAYYHLQLDTLWYSSVFLCNHNRYQWRLIESASKQTRDSPKLKDSRRLPFLVFEILILVIPRYAVKTYRIVYYKHDTRRNTACLLKSLFIDNEGAIFNSMSSLLFTEGCRVFSFYFLSVSFVQQSELIAGK